MSDTGTVTPRTEADPVPCGRVMATCQLDEGHPGACWHPRVTDNLGVMPLRPVWIRNHDAGHSKPEQPLAGEGER